MEASAKYWFDQVSADLDTARFLLRSGRYQYAVFALHLALEKFLKGYVAEYTGRTPPRTHDLGRLAELGDIILPADHGLTLDKLTRLAQEARYPTHLIRFTRRLARETFASGEAALEWLQHNRSSSPL